jgi:hypothetical protein
MQATPIYSQVLGPTTQIPREMHLISPNSSLNIPNLSSSSKRFIIRLQDIKNKKHSPRQRVSSNLEDSSDEERSSHIKPVPSNDKKTSDKKGLQPATRPRKSEEKKLAAKRKAKMQDKMQYKKQSRSSKLKAAVQDIDKEASNPDTTPGTQNYLAPRNEAEKDSPTTVTKTRGRKRKISTLQPTVDTKCNIGSAEKEDEPSKALNLPDVKVEEESKVLSEREPSLGQSRRLPGRSEPRVADGREP